MLKYYELTSEEFYNLDESVQYALLEREGLDAVPGPVLTDEEIAAVYEELRLHPEEF